MSKHEPPAVDGPVSVDPQARVVAARRAHGSHVATLEQLLRKREALVREVGQTTEAINETYRKAVAAERIDRTLTPVLAPGRRADVTLLLPVRLEEHPPADTTALARLIDLVQQETAARAARAASERARVAQSGLTRLPSEGGVPLGNL